MSGAPGWSEEAADLLGVNLRGQRIVLVGVGGIGTEVGRICQALGARLTLVDPSMSETVRRTFRGHELLELDITDDEALRAVVQKCQGANALIVTSAVCPDEAGDRWDDAHWQERFDGVFRLNVQAPMRLGLAFLKAHATTPPQSHRSRARLVLVGSMAGRMGGLLAGPQYAASKGALHTFVRWLALRAAPMGISVNGVAPGVTATPMIEGRRFDATRIPAGRAADPLEVARVVTFLASPASSYLHGQVVDVNGGAWIG